MRLGEYELGDEVGRGAFGAVFRARTRTGRVVAVKLIRSTGEGERIARELRLLSSLGPGDGFVGILDAGVSERGGFYLVMPFLGGGTLRDRLHRGPLAVPEAVALGRALARALSLAHGRGIVHRDLKPENVLYAEDGRVFVGDLGLAKHFRKDLPGGSLSLSLSQGGRLKGTIGYASPEQLRDAKEVGPATDVFALGAILHECLAGVPAFAGETPLAVLAKVESGDRASLAEACPAAPRELVRVIERALEPDPASRFADAGELLRALDAASAPRPPRGLAVARRIGGACALAGVLALGAALAVSTRRGAPGTGSPPQAPPPASGPAGGPSAAGGLPALCASFLHGKRLRLLQVVGEYDLRVAGEVHALACSPDGTLLLSGQGHHDVGETQWGNMLDKTLALWDAASGREVRRFVGHTSGVTGCAFLPDGRRALSGSYDGTIRIWDVATGRSTKSIETGSPVLALSLARDGETVAVGLANGRVSLHDLETGEVRQPLERHPGGCLAVALSRDGSILLAGGADGTAFLWDLGDNKGRPGAAVPWRFSTKAAVRAALIAPGEERGYLGDDAGTLRELDLRKGVVHATVTDATPSPITAIALARGLLLTAHKDGTLRERATSDLAVRGEVDRRTLPLRAIAASADGALTAWAGFDGTIATLGSSSRTLVHKATRVAVTRPGGVERLATCGTDGTLRLWDGATGSPLWTRRASEGQLYSVASSPDGRQLVTAGESGAVSVWSAASGESALSFDGRGATYKAIFATSGDGILACCQDGRVRLLGASEEPRELRGHEHGVFAVVPHPDGRRAVSGGVDKTIRVWDLARGVELSRIADVHRELVGALAIAPGGERVLSGSWDGSVKLWDLASGALVRELPAHPRPCWAVSFLDARRAVVAWYDGALSVLDVESGELLDSVSLESATDWTGNLVPVGDGRTFLAGTCRGVVLRFLFE